VESYDLGRRTLADQIDELETGDEIDAELARLKQSVGGGTQQQ
jgi:phage shock protein A